MAAQSGRPAPDAGGTAGCSILEAWCRSTSTRISPRASALSPVRRGGAGVGHQREPGVWIPRRQSAVVMRDTACAALGSWRGHRRPRLRFATGRDSAGGPSRSSAAQLVDDIVEQCETLDQEVDVGWGNGGVRQAARRAVQPDGHRLLHRCRGGRRGRPAWQPGPGGTGRVRGWSTRPAGPSIRLVPEGSPTAPTWPTVGWPPAMTPGRCSGIPPPSPGGRCRCRSGRRGRGRRHLDTGRGGDTLHPRRLPRCTQSGTSGSGGARSRRNRPGSVRPAGSRRPAVTAVIARRLRLATRALLVGRRRRLRRAPVGGHRRTKPAAEGRAPDGIVDTVVGLHSVVVHLDPHADGPTCRAVVDTARRR